MVSFLRRLGTVLNQEDIKNLSMIEIGSKQLTLKH